MSQTNAQQHPGSDHDLNGNRRWVWFITGPTASGKTTIAKALADSLGFTFVEGDDVRTDPGCPSTPPPPQPAFPLLLPEHLLVFAYR
jgi:gluconokinase